MTTCEDIILYLHKNQDGIPHLHATYQGQESIITLPDCSLRKGNLPENKMQQLQAWVEVHRHKLMADREAVRFRSDLCGQES